MEECWYLLTQDQKFNFKGDLISISSTKLNIMSGDFNVTFISLVTLFFLIISSLSWFILKILKEGRKAITEIKKNSK